MREIKFKIWDDQNKVWATDNQFHLIREEKTNVFCFRNYLKKNEPQGDVQYILCQSIGLKDKNGKEAYYGDIIEHSTTEGGIFRRVISWDEELQCTMIDNMPYYRLHESGYIQPSKLEFIIVGNIYETPTP